MKILKKLNDQIEKPDNEKNPVLKPVGNKKSVTNPEKPTEPEKSVPKVIKPVEPKIPKNYQSFVIIPITKPDRPVTNPEIPVTKPEISDTKTGKSERTVKPVLPNKSENCVKSTTPVIPVIELGSKIPTQNRTKRLWYQTTKLNLIKL